MRVATTPTPAQAAAPPPRSLLPTRVGSSAQSSRCAGRLVLLGNPPTQSPPRPAPACVRRRLALPQCHRRPPPRGADLASRRPGEVVAGGWGRACRGPARAWASPTRRGPATPAAARAAGVGRGGGAAAVSGRGGGRRHRAPRRWRPSRRPRCPVRRPPPRPITGRTATPRSKVGRWVNGQAAFSSSPRDRAPSARCLFRGSGF
jgi:hypothetical protein